MIRLILLILQLPKKFKVWINRIFVKETREAITDACQELDKYAADILGIQITEGRAHGHDRYHGSIPLR